MSGLKLIAWCQEASPAGITCLAGLSLLLGTPKEECLDDLAFFATVTCFNS